MSNDRDPLLESLFAEAVYEPVDDNFNAEVMANVEKRRRNVFIGRSSEKENAAKSGVIGAGQRLRLSSYCRSRS